MTYPINITIEDLVSQGYRPDQAELLNLVGETINESYEEGIAGQPFSFGTWEEAEQDMKSFFEGRIISNSLSNYIIRWFVACRTAYEQGQREAGE